MLLCANDVLCGCQGNPRACGSRRSSAPPLRDDREARWGTPIDEENLLSIAAIDPNDYPKASDVFDELRSASYVTNRGGHGIELDNSSFGELAEILFQECGWEPFHIKSRLKHYEGWDQHDWA